MAKQYKISGYTKDETIRFFHKGVKVNVHIDYDQGLISLVDDQGKPTKYCFADRQIEYMNGWRLVLQAMDLAIQEAEGKLSAHQKKVEKEKEEMMVRVLSEVSKQDLQL